MPLFGVANANDGNSKPYLLIDAKDEKHALNILLSKAKTEDTLATFYNQCHGAGTYEEEEDIFDDFLSSEQSRQKYLQCLFRIVGPFDVIQQ